MIVVMHFHVEDVSFGEELLAALVVLAARPGYVRGSGARSTDEISDWVLVTEWESVGAYRRALGNYDVKLYATPVLARAIDQPSAFEQLVSVSAEGTVTRANSDRAIEPIVRNAETAFPPAHPATDGVGR